MVDTMRFPQIGLFLLNGKLIKTDFPSLKDVIMHVLTSSEYSLSEVVIFYNGLPLKIVFHDQYKVILADDFGKTMKEVNLI